MEPRCQNQSLPENLMETKCVRYAKLDLVYLQGLQLLLYFIRAADTVLIIA